MSIDIGDKIPALSAPASGGGTLKLAQDYTGQNLVVYFYPRDNTPGCTLEGQDFTRLYPQFEHANTAVVGVSKDSVKSHDNFCAKFGFPFKLLSDTDEAVCQAFGAIVEKSMYGKKYLGIDRCTFLFNAKGKLVRVWRNVKAKGHAEEVLAAAQAL